MNRPSSLPALAKCSSFESAPNPYFEPGAKRHKALAAMLSSPWVEWDFLLSDFDEETQEGLAWAAKYILDNAPGKLTVEKKLQWPDPLKPDQLREGTPDVIAPGIIFDLKWRDVDCFAQMADYALGYMANWQKPDVTVKVLYAASKFVEEYFFTYAEARNVVAEILASIDTAGERHPGGQCSWCRHQLECPAVHSVIAKVAQAKQADFAIESCPVAFISDAKALGGALRAARLLRDWCEAVESHVKFMKEQGVLPEGFVIKPKRGNRYIKDVTVASRTLGIAAETLLKHCKVPLSTFKKLYAEKEKLKPTPAEKEMFAKLEAANAIERESSYDTIVEQKTKPGKEIEDAKV